MARLMGFGVNIGNTLENTTWWETGWGQPSITDEFVRGLAARGVKTVRLPVAWDTYAVNGVIPADKMARVREVVSSILAADMFAIVNIHWDGGWIRGDGTSNQYRLTDEVREKFEGYWEQIALAMADLDGRLIFESMNEEGEFYLGGDKQAGRDYASLNELNQSFVDTVRAAGGWNRERNLLIAGFVTDIAATCVDDFGIPDDAAGGGRLFLSVHYYTPVPFCILNEPADWGEMVYPATTWGTAAEQQELTQKFTRLAGFCEQRRIPAIIGEFQASEGTGAYVRETASRIRWLTQVSNTALDHGMVPVLWDTGGDIDRESGAFSAVLTEVWSQLHL